MVIKKVFLSVSIATISTFLQKGTLWRHNYGTSQPKFGQCDIGCSHSASYKLKPGLALGLLTKRLFYGRAMHTIS